MSFLFFDVSDMLYYLSHHRHVSGIQRTQSNLVRSVCSAGRDFKNVHFVALSADRSWYQVLDKGALADLMLALPDLEIAHDSIRTSIQNVLSSGVPPVFRTGDVYVVTGAFWIYDDIYGLLNKLKTLDVTIGCYVYDLIPINQPDFCTKELTDAFTRAFNRISLFADFMLTISDHTRKEVDEYIRQSGLPKTITSTVRLAHTMSDQPPEEDGFDLRGMVFNDFVLCVGTIEARKNHQLLYQVWKLLAEGGMRPMPKLVIVGRWGWRVDDLQSQLAATNNLDGAIVILPGVDDETLGLLYRECKFTIFPSFVEGWGLPVGESLVHGRFCLASHSSSIPEVGGRFVDYIDPYNARRAYEVVRKYLDSPALLEEKHALIRSEFIARTWEDFRDDFIATASRCADQVSSDLKPPVYPTLRDGESIDATDQRVSGIHAAALVDPALAFVAGWDIPEALGRWMRGRTAELAFRSGDRSERFLIRFGLFSVPWASGNTIHVSCLDSQVSHVVPPGARFDVDLQVDLSRLTNGPVVVSFHLEGQYDHRHDTRDICVGLSSMFMV